MKTFMRVAVSLALTACGGAATPKTAAAPSAETPKLTDAEVSAISVAAAETLLPTGSPTTFFAGVFVKGQRSRLASEAVARTNGFTLGDPGRGATPQCRAQNMSTGQSKPIPCPASVARSIPPTYSFVEVRKTNDLASVGVELRNNDVVQANCINLRLVGNHWTMVNTTPAGDAKRCGR
jgi:hypothetical protein